MEEAALGMQGGGDPPARPQRKQRSQQDSSTAKAPRASPRDDKEDGRAHTSVQDLLELGHEAGFETADPLPPRCPFTLCSSFHAKVAAPRIATLKTGPDPN